MWFIANTSVNNKVCEIIKYFPSVKLLLAGGGKVCELLFLQPALFVRNTGKQKRDAAMVEKGTR